MDHLPINHHLRPLYRVLAFLTGVYILVFGILGYVKSKGLETFAQPNDADLPRVLWLDANPAFSILSIVVGAVVVLAVIVGRNVDFYVNLLAGSVFLLASMAMMALLHTDLNYLGFTMATCIASMILGLIMFTAGLYGRVGSSEREAAAEAHRHGQTVTDH
ncbi:DUF4383 domain-containing protein [Stackebrandtia nassauensis]|uniref:DUF4383 domain-containing protein n=1 Tax=Stackebrandtia nassauensis TaxID=283811 RepID=UPI0005A13706|nr:DUF4383 domain-containing protein [Stackebrandtia nassauensis]